VTRQLPGCTGLHQLQIIFQGASLGGARPPAGGGGGGGGVGVWGGGGGGGAGA
jgi:hypothetical protein